MAVTVFIFRADDGRTPEERLKAAARTGGYGKKTGEKNFAGAESTEGEFIEEESGIWRIARTKQGKPYFPKQPELFFSISHSGIFWVCAFAGKPIGVDLQKHVKKAGENREEAAQRLNRLAERFFHPKEVSWVRREGYEGFFRIWAAKESYVKYTGEGIGANFGKISLAPEKKCLKGDMSRWRAENIWFCSMEIWQEPERYTLCVCCEEAEESVAVRDLSGGQEMPDFPGENKNSEYLWKNKKENDR